MKNDKVSTFKIAAAYIGTVVGAGFASGQEILRFFALFGGKGFWGLLLVTFLFMLFGYIIMDLGLRLNSYSHLRVIMFSGGRFLGTIIDYIITFFLFGALTAMMAGSGAMFAQQFQISEIGGNLIMAVATAITVLTGINGVINSISFVVPFLIVSALGVSITYVYLLPPTSITVQVSVHTDLIKNWLLAAVLYTSYNIILSVAVLSPLGAKAINRKAIRNGAILGGLGLGVGALAIYMALIKDIKSVMNIEIPMLFIAGRISYAVQIIYAVVLLAEIYTTAVGSLYGFAARITDPQSNKAKYVIIATTVLAFVASRFGFSNLVKYVYPLVGYGGLTLLIAMLYKKLTLSFRGAK